MRRLLFRIRQQTHLGSLTATAEGDAEPASAAVFSRSDPSRAKLALRRHSEVIRGPASPGAHDWSSTLPPEPVGRARLHLAVRRLRAGGAWWPRDAGAAGQRSDHGDLARPPAAARICAAHDPADAVGDHRIAHFHFRLCHRRREEPASGDGADSAPRHPPVGAGAGLPVVHRGRLHGALPGTGARCRTRRGVRDLHEFRPGT